MIKPIVISLCLASLATAGPAYADGRVETKPYLGAAGLVACDALAVGTDRTLVLRANVSGACFDVTTTDASVTIGIDDLVVSDVAGSWSFLRSSSDKPIGKLETLARGEICGHASQIPVPSGADILFIELHSTQAQLEPISLTSACGTPIAHATTGTVTAAFRSA